MGSRAGPSCSAAAGAVARAGAGTGATAGAGVGAGAGAGGGAEARAGVEAGTEGGAEAAFWLRSLATSTVRSCAGRYSTRTHPAAAPTAMWEELQGSLSSTEEPRGRQRRSCSPGAAPGTTASSAAALQPEAAESSPAPKRVPCRLASVEAGEVGLPPWGPGARSVRTMQAAGTDARGLLPGEMDSTATAPVQGIGRGAAAAVLPCCIVVAPAARSRVLVRLPVVVGMAAATAAVPGGARREREAAAVLVGEVVTADPVEAAAAVVAEDVMSEIVAAAGVLDVEAAAVVVTSPRASPFFCSTAEKHGSLGRKQTVLHAGRWQAQRIALQHPTGPKIKGL